MVRRLIFATATFAWLAGCASDAPPPPPVSVAPPAPPPAAGQTVTPAAYDGLYKYTVSHGIEKNRGVRCNHPIGNMRVRNGVASTRWRGPLRGPVNPDGTLDLKNLATHLTGQFADGVFSGKLDTPVCAFTFILTKQ